MGTTGGQIDYIARIPGTTTFWGTGILVGTSFWSAQRRNSRMITTKEPGERQLS